MSPNHDGLPNSAEPASTNAGDTAANLLTIMRELLLEIRQSERDVPTLTLDSHIDRDLALDSLARTELLQRIERNFRVQMDEKVLLAESPRDLLELILRACGQPPEATALAPNWQAPTAQQAATVGLPDGAETLIDMLDWYVGRQPERVAIQIYGNDDR
ncbi:MAG TPA: acyl carrier protein, partial [Candidatus Competibacter sp.]|nr:acyl carrier protein [Candidatus Competibacter sp.]